MQTSSTLDKKEPAMVVPQTIVTDFITEYDLYLLREGKHLQMYNKMLMALQGFTFAYGRLMPKAWRL
jgi:hypothetical protein